MAQVIHVRFLNPDSHETLHENFTLASTHKESIDIAMDRFSGGTGLIKEIEQVGEMKHMLAGINNCYRYTYYCTVADDEYDRTMYAILDAQYPEMKDRKNNAAVS